MKISSITEDQSGRRGIRAEPQGYDGVPPIDTLYLDGAPLLNNDDRLAVAATLAFGRYVSGSLELPSACSPATASAIARYLAPIAVAVTPVALEPRALPIGAGLCICLQQGDAVEAPANARGERRIFTLTSLRSDQYAGCLAAMASLDVATNAWLHARPQDSELQSRSASLAVAVLYAETLQIDELSVPPMAVEPATVARIRDLLGSVRLGFSVMGGER